MVDLQLLQIRDADMRVGKEDEMDEDEVEER